MMGEWDDGIGMGRPWIGGGRGCLGEAPHALYGALEKTRLKDVM